MLAVFAGLCVSLRLFMYGSLGNPFYDGNYFHLGLIPWSDGGGWSGGALELLHGHRLTEYPAFRPLTPGFLAVLFTLTGINYYWTAVLQLALLTLALLAAAWILRDVRPRLAVLFFMASLLLWQGDLFSAFVTELPSTLVLLPGFALLLRGSLQDSKRDYALGLFLFGLSQAIRPWNVGTLLLLPLLAFHGPGWTRRGARLFLIYTACAGLGFAFHQAGSLLLNDQGAAEGSYDKSVYGRVFGCDWAEYYRDPVIRVAREDTSLSPVEFRQVVYRYLATHVKEHPEDLGRSLIRSVNGYFSLSSRAFVFVPLGFFLLCLAAWPWRELWERLHAAKRYGVPLLVVAGAAMFMGRVWQYVSCAACGLACVWLWRYGRRTRLTLFIGLFWAGIFLSLPLVGNDGGSRPMLANDLLLFWLAGLGFSWLAARFPQGRVEDHAPAATGWEWRRDGHPVWFAASVSAIVLLVWPAVIRATAVDPDPPVTVSKAAAQTILQLPVSPLDADDLSRIWNRLDKPSFMTYDKQPAFWVMRLNLRDLLELKAGDGLPPDSPRLGYYWPLVAQAYERTVWVRELRLAVLPGVSKAELAGLEDRQVIVFGRLSVRPRKSPWETGFCLYVSRLAWRQDNGQWTLARLRKDGW